ncbi:MAG: DUF2974 domain-containing protein [Clostridiaceae bacterium]|nr:DUF2974 domain-containing protein [Clostridiaceae bacterium]
MGNIIDYVRNELRTFEVAPFNDVDSLVLSQFSYLDLSDIVGDPFEDLPAVRLRDLYRAEHFSRYFEGTFSPELNLRLLEAMSASPRFRDIKLNYYISELDVEAQMQFSATTFILNDDNCYIAFRGTDGTIIGWKEDFNMAFSYPLPSQEAALLYVNAVCGFLPGNVGLFVGGHSKGGNLAVYAAMNTQSNNRDRITYIYNHDGPGFSEEVIHSEEYLRVADRIRKTLPASSLIGILLHHHSHYRVVDSNAKGLMQHDPFTWNVEGDDFVWTDELRGESVHTHRTINLWLSKLSPEKRRMFVDTLYSVVESTSAKSLFDLTDDWMKGAGMVIAAYKELDPESRKFLQDTFAELVKLSIKNRRPSRKLSIVKTVNSTAIGNGISGDIGMEPPDDFPVF